MLQCSLLHVVFLLLRKAKKAQNTILKRRYFEGRTELFVACMEIAVSRRFASAPTAQMCHKNWHKHMLLENMKFILFD